MQAWYLNENPYPFVPQSVLDSAYSVRGSLPNKLCDPKVAADLFEEALDEYLLCDDLGINVVSNEHHAGINCLFGGWGRAKGTAWYDDIELVKASNTRVLPGTVGQAVSIIAR